MINDKASKIVGIMFMSRTAAHMAHLKTSSYAKHMALNSFYDTVVDMADSIAEVAQGISGKLDIPYLPLKGDIEDPIEMLDTHRKMINTVAKGCDDRALNAIVDEILGLYSKTLYLLKDLD